MTTTNPLPKANASFSLTLLKKLSEDDKTGNIFFSPFSISSALAMVMLGTRGRTAMQISEVLCITEKEQPKGTEGLPSAMHSQMQARMQMRSQLQQTSRLPGYLLKCLKPQSGQDEVHANFAKLMSDINKVHASNTISLANKLYGEKTYTFLEDFLADAKKHYGSELESVDFSTNFEEARVNINSWVEEQTQGKIKELLVQGVVSDITKMVLVNAIYFKGNWAKQFKEELTVDATFRINKNDTKEVKMMCQKSEFQFTSIPEANCQILEMPYEGEDLSMLIFLPDDIEDDSTGLEKLEKELTYEKFEEWTRPDMMGKAEIDVKLPRFKMEEKYDLVDVLTAMGMTDVFEVTRSDFSGMTTANNLALSAVIHKAFVEVNEEGTEAAAATGAVIDERALKIPVTFTADHPFLFFIRHNPTKSVLFAGRYCSPE